jgi:hypothetical protein
MCLPCGHLLRYLGSYPRSIRINVFRGLYGKFDSLLFHLCPLMGLLSNQMRVGNNTHTVYESRWKSHVVCNSQAGRHGLPTFDVMTIMLTLHHFILRGGCQDHARSFPCPNSRVI